MKEPGRLALRVPPKEEEPPYGLFCRLAARPGFSDAREFATRVNLSFSEIVHGREGRAVEALAGLADGALQNATAVLSESAAHFRAHDFLKNDWPATPARVCIGCLRDDLEAGGSNGVPHRRFWWHFKPIDACPRHSALLESRCRRCAEVFLPFRTDLVRCACGANLLDHAPVAAEPGLVRADRYLLSRLLGRPHRKLQVLDEVPLRYVLSTMLTVGTPTGVRPGNLLDPAAEGRFDAKADAYRMFRRWPRAFHEKLDRLRRIRPDAEAKSRSDRVSPYLRYQHVLGSILTAEAQGPIREAYKIHFLRNVAAGLNTRIFQEPATGTTRVTLQAANPSCGLHQTSRRLLPILRDMGLIGDGLSLYSVTVPRGLLPQLRNELENFIGSGDAISALGLTDSSIKILVEDGHIEYVKNSYDEIPRFNRTSIEYLLFDLANGTVRKPDPGEALLSVLELARMRLGEQILGLTRAIAAVRSGATPVVALDPERKGLAGLMVRRKAAVALKRARSAGVDAVTAARILRIKDHDLSRLAQLGLLIRTEKDDRLPGPYNAGSYRHADLCNFKERYATLKDCARMARVRSNEIREVLEKFGIRPVASPPQTLQTYYALTADLKTTTDLLARRTGTLGEWLERQG